MSKQTKKKAGPAAKATDRIISQNRKARHNYIVLDTLECGIVLVGSEVKSLRIGRVSLEEAYARIKNDEVWLVGCDIAEYVEANRFNHQPRRPRKLLLHRREVKRFAHRAYEKGLTLVPLGDALQARAGQGRVGHLPGQAAARQTRGDEEVPGPTRHGPADDAAEVRDQGPEVRDQGHEPIPVQA